VSVDITIPQPPADERPVLKARADEREQAKREGGVRRHHDPPAACGRASGIESEVDGDRHRHAADPRQQGQGEAPPLPQLTQVELAASLEPDNEEEERHQTAVHPVTKI
jgi:hypothetical protein